MVSLDDVNTILQRKRALLVSSPNDPILLDEIETLEMAHILLRKMRDDPSHIYIDREDWTSNAQYSRLKFLLGRLKIEGVIDTYVLTFGGMQFDIIDRRSFLQRIDNELGDFVGDSTVEEPVIEQRIVVRTFEEFEYHLDIFRQYMHKHGYLSLWERASVRNNLRSYPEEIARQLVMSYLTAIKGNTFREVPTAQGRMDIVFIIPDATAPIVVEVKVPQSNTDYEEGFSQLIYYLERENCERGYYLVFDPSGNRVDEERVVGGRKLIGRVINLHQEPPDRSRET